THTFDDGGSAAVAHAEAFTRDSAEECLAARCAVQRGVADDDVLVCLEGRAVARTHGEQPARHAFAHVVVGIASERELDTVHQERAEALPRRTPEMELDAAFGQAELA